MPRFEMRLTQDDAERLSRLAASRGCTRSQLVRRLLLAAEGKPAELVPQEEELLELLAERARAGHVRAIELLLRRQDRTPQTSVPTVASGATDDPFAEVDELAAMRRRDRPTAAIDEH